MAERSVKDLLVSSNVAFTGTVEETRKSTVGGIDVDDRTVVVRVARLLHGPPEISLPEGSRVTIQLSPDLPSLPPGEQATFFADGLIYGDTLAVAEVGRVPVEETAVTAPEGADIEEWVSPVEAAAGELADDDLIEHARDADLVVRAQVTALSQVPKEAPPTEHDPDWWIATLEADVVARGTLPGGTQEGGTVSALYANSLDARWRQAPKPKAGQGGLWLLHSARDELSSFAPFELIHPIDVQRSIRLDLLRERGLEG
jgi:hypothetical protein